MARRQDTPAGVLATLFRILRFWKPHRRAGMLLLALLLVPKLYDTFFAYSLRLLVDGALAEGQGELLTQIILALVAGFLVAAVASLAGEYLMARVGAAILNQIRLQMFDRLLGLSADFFARARTGDVAARFSGDLAELDKGLTTRIVDGFYALAGMVINLPLLFMLETRLALLTMAGIPAVALGTRLFSGKAARMRFELKESEASVVDSVQETIRAQGVVRVFGLAPWARQQFTSQLDTVETKAVQAGFSAKLVATTSSLGVLAVQVAVLAVGGWLSFQGELSLGSLVAFVSLHGLVSKDAYDLTKKVVPSLIRSSGSLLRIEQLLDEAVGVEDRADARPLESTQGEITFDSVSFSYPGGPPVIDDFSDRIQSGETIAIVGPSGSGKSSLLGLLLRFHDPDEGEVLLDGEDLRTFSQDSLRSKMGVVFQDSFLFNLSIRENLQLGRLGASDREIEAAAAAAEIHDFVSGLPEGYDTQVGELGSRLSGGQRQRLAIARAILRNPHILLLDEATSALDPAIEASLNQTLAELGRDRTVVSVTHRLSSARHADRIVVIDKGRLVESGTHGDLLAANGLYCDLWTRQQGVEVSGEGDDARVSPNLLSRVPTLAGLDERLLSLIASTFSARSYPAGEDIFREGDRGQRFYVIARGKVAVITEKSGGEIARLDDGCFFGEISLLEDHPRMATVRTLTPCLMLFLDRSEFLRLMRQEPAIRELVESESRRRQSENRPT